jgi:hypothetical protein
MFRPLYQVRRRKCIKEDLLIIGSGKRGEYPVGLIEDTPSGSAYQPLNTGLPDMAFLLFCVNAFKPGTSIEMIRNNCFTAFFDKANHLKFFTTPGKNREHFNFSHGIEIPYKNM